MQHIKFLISVIIVIAGLYVTFRINNVRRKHRFSYLAYLVFYTLIVNVLFSIIMFAIYFKLNMPIDFFLNRSSVTGNIISLVLYVFIFVLIYLMILIVMDLLGKKLSFKWNIILSIVFFLGILVEFTQLFYPLFFKSSKVLSILYNYVVDNIIFLEFFSLLMLIIRGFRIPDKKQRGLSLSFGYYFISRYILLTGGYLVFLVSGSSNLISFMIQGLMFFCMILIPFLWIKIHFLKYVKPLDLKKDYNPVLENICRNYGISSREREIIVLMVAGKTNKEIENELFISINTVKNHIYNIFKKLKINSRHQLIKFFTQI